MRRFARAWPAVLLVILAAPWPVVAKTCALDAVPAATLLLPYFEVDLEDPAGRTTLVSIANAVDRPALAHFVLWTDLGLPTLAFDVYLTGYDVQTINLRDVFAGKLPRTASDGQDPDDQISPQGTLSQDIDFASCAGLLPPADLAASFVDHLRKLHQGLSSALQDSQCAAQFFGLGTARGYATIDVVRRCSVLTPASPGYFGPDGVAAHDNVLWGDFFFVDPAGNLAQGASLVRIESDPARFAGRPTFYARYVSFNGADGREPLPTVWGVRFIDGDAFTGGSDLVYWRDSRRRGAAFPCHQLPSWYPIRLVDEKLFAFDEQETVDVLASPIVDPPLPPPPSPFPAESGRVAVGGPELPVPWSFGWWFLDLKSFAGAPPELTQSWIGVLHQAQGLFSVGLKAEPFDSGCSPRTSVPGF